MEGGCTSLSVSSLLGLRIVNTLGKDGSVLGSSILGLLSISALQRNTMTLVLQTLRSNQSLNLWCLGVWLLTLALWLNFTTDDKLADIVFLGEAEELADLGSTLGTETLWVNNVGDAGDLSVTLLDDRESQYGQIHRDDAATDGFTLALTSSAGSVAGVTIGEEKADTGWVHDSLLHWETLLVVATGNLEDVALELISNAVTRNLCAHSLVQEDAKLALLFDFN